MKPPSRGNFLYPAISLLALLPGLVTIYTGIGVPPKTKLLFGSITIAIGAISLLILHVNGFKIAVLPASRVTRLSVILISLCFASLTLYTLIYQWCVVEVNGEVVYYPLWTSGDLAKMIEIAGTRTKAIERYASAAINPKVNEMTGALTLTTTLLLILYEGIFASLTFAAGILCLKKTDRREYYPVIPAPENKGIFHPEIPMDTDIHHTANESIPSHIFISYSHKDRRWLNKLQTMLQPLVRSNRLSIWDDTRIRSGDNWMEEIEKALVTAKCAVLLVSPNFLASDFIAIYELPHLLEAAQKRGLKVIWIAISACVYQQTEISKYQAANNPEMPLDTLSPAKQNQILSRICKELCDLQ